MEAFGRTNAAAEIPTEPGASRPIGGRELLRAVETVSCVIRDPAAKLRFIRRALARYRRLQRLIRHVPFASLRKALERRMGLQDLPLLTGDPLGTSGPVRRAVSPALVLSAALLAAVVGIVAFAALRPSRDIGPVVAAAAAMVAAPAPAPVANADPPVLPSVGVSPAAIWQVEKGAGWEQYSNGLRIDTGSSVRGDPRRYRVFTLDGRFEDPVYRRPVGILFHTSESDVWPLEEGFNEKLRTSTMRLLRYVARERLYHYLVDRFGRVYRVVEEESKANHAGHSVWMDQDKVYLNLNHAFLGVSFETRWEGGRALPITQAQFAAGRSLADYLRQQWGISSGMCVVHGLTSVNPRKHLIGHHLDWARGFPFEAFGLPDQYRRPDPSVALFGFEYDEDFLKVLGEPWEGVRSAERLLEQEAVQRKRTVQEVRGEKQGLYDRWILEQAEEEASGASRQAEQSPPRGESGG